MSESTLERESPPEAGGTEVIVGATGQELREHREALGASLSDVSDTLCIRREFLESLESGHYDALPGAAYAVGFVRSYAKYLGLDADAMARQFKVELTGERPTARLDFLTPAAESRVPTAAIVFVAVLLAIAIYGLWYFFNARDVSVSDVVPEIPPRLAATVAPRTAPTPAVKPAPGTPAPPASGLGTDPAKPAEAVQPPAPAGAATAAAPADRKPAGSPTAGDLSKTAKTAAPQSAAESAAQPTPRLEVMPAAPESPALANGSAPKPQAAAPEAVASEAAADQATAQAAAIKPPLPAPIPPTRRPDPPREAGGGQQVASAAPSQPEASAAPAAGKLAVPRVVLQAKADSWVELRTGSGELVISRVLTKGTTYSVPPRPGMTLTTGNAGGLEILVDGVALPPLGPAGAVRRDISLDPDGLKGRIAGRSR
ncbi:MAG: DUF4115 domain-containing protein [Alphaproteobacteria bacterium]|nr:DUF4115 domain-containing protein [Alphaproteobacteria bacterium]